MRFAQGILNNSKTSNQSNNGKTKIILYRVNRVIMVMMVIYYKLMNHATWLNETRVGLGVLIDLIQAFLATAPDM